MITKERLQELIEQGATIYVPDDLWQTVGKIHLEKKCYISEDNRLCNDEITFKDLPSATAMYSIPLEDIFETEEDACWELEMTATRTETLRLPTFEEITSNKDDIETRVIGFYVDRIYYILEYASDLDGNWRICLEKDTIEDCEYLFEAKPTKENYLKACKMAKKLFLGEEKE